MLAYGMAALFLIAANPEVATTNPSPVTYKMQPVWIAGTEPTEWVFVVGQVGFKSLGLFKEFVGRLPKGSTLEWAPGCKGRGGEPLLSSEEEMAAFRKLCEERGINFVLIPSG